MKQEISKRAISMKKGKFFLVALCAIMLVQCYCKTTVAEAATNNKVAIEFINVASRSGGKADATLIATKAKDGTAVYTLVDCGTKESADYLLYRLRTVHKVTEIQNLVLTHNHSDHKGGLERLLNSTITVKNIYMNTRGGASVEKIISQSKKGKSASLHSYGDNEKDPIVNLNTGKGSNVQIKLYTSKNRTTYGTEISNLNERSLVVEVVGGSTSCLLLGDLRRYGLGANGNLIAGGLKIFKDNYGNVLKGNYTVVKVGHHGYRKSGTYDETAVQNEVNYYNRNFKATNYVFTATSSVLNTAPENFKEFKKLNGTCYWFQDKSITFGDWNEFPFDK